MANNPVTFDLAVDTWVKVATAVTAGVVRRLSTLPERYLQTIRVTGDPAPTTDADAARLFTSNDYAGISSDSAIDVYVKARGAAGKVRVDL